jgi:hypothetical protein
VDNPSFTDKSPLDIHPNLDYDDDGDEHGKNAIDGDDVLGKSMEFSKNTFKQSRRECKQNCQRVTLTINGY